MRSYVGNVTTFATKEANTAELASSTLSQVSRMVSASIREAATEERFQEMVDWMEEHKREGRWVERVSVGLGSPTVTVTSFHGFSLDLDLGFGPPALVMPRVPKGRLSAAFLQVAAWNASAVVWPKLADALESDGLFKPITARHLGLVEPAAPGPVCKL